MGGSVSISESGIHDTTVIGTYAQGGALFLGSLAAVTMTHSTISAAYVQGRATRGGCLQVQSGNFSAVGVNMTDCAALGFASQGGGLNLDSGTITLDYSHVSNVFCAFFGGGMYIGGGSIRLTSSSLSNAAARYDTQSSTREGA